MLLGCGNRLLGVESEHFPNADEVVGLIAILANEVFGGFHGVGAADAEGYVAAVVEQDDFAAADLLAGVALDGFVGFGAPVVTGDVPHDWRETEGPRGLESSGAAAAEGRTEERWGKAAGVFDGFLRLGELAAGFCG